MRFDIRAGGLFGIFFGIAVLSGAVFVMGLVAGYDVGHQSRVDEEKMVLDYPIASPAAAPPSLAAAVPTPIVNQSPAAIARNNQATPAATPSITQLASNPKPRPAVASTPKSPVSAPPPPPAEEPAEAATPSERTAAAEPPAAPAVRHKPFNIEIQAVMDSDNANQIVRNLTALGYKPRMIPTAINGKTWYKVEVGPYATREQAATAEAELRRRYNSTYGNGSTPAQPAENPNEEPD